MRELWKVIQLSDLKAIPGLTVEVNVVVVDDMMSMNSADCWLCM